MGCSFQTCVQIAAGGSGLFVGCTFAKGVKVGNGASIELEQCLICAYTELKCYTPLSVILHNNRIPGAVRISFDRRMAREHNKEVIITRNLFNGRPIAYSLSFVRGRPALFRVDDNFFASENTDSHVFLNASSWNKEVTFRRNTFWLPLADTKESRGTRFAVQVRNGVKLVLQDCVFEGVLQYD